MKRLFTGISIIGIFSSIFFFSVSATDVNIPSTNFPQARPILQLLRSLENSDAEGLKTVFCDRIRQELTAENDWPKILEYYQEAFSRVIGGKIVTSDFKFTYKEKDSNSGFLYCYYKDKQLKDVEMVVIFEGGAWKLAEK